MREGQKEKIKIENLTDKVQVEEGYLVDILNVFLDMREQYNQILQSDEYKINPNIIIFLSKYKVKSQTFKRREYLSKFKEYEEKLKVEKGIAQISELDLTVGNRKHIKNLTDKLEQEIPLDILDIFLRDRNFYKSVTHCKRYRIDANIINFLRSCKSDKKYYGRENYIKKYKDYLERIRAEGKRTGTWEIKNLTDEIDYSVKDFLDLFLTDKISYNKVIHSSKYQIDPDIIHFFATYKSQRQNYGKHQRNEYIKAFKEYKEYQKLLNDDYETLSDILKNTREHNIAWKKRRWKKTSRFLEQEFTADYKINELVFSVLGRSQESNKWKVNMSLEINRKQNIVSKKHKYYELLYKEILKYIQAQDDKQFHEKKQKLQANTRHISSDDFVVRTNVFKCISEHHHLEEVLGIIRVVKPDGTTLEEKVTTAYCKECGCYFLMRSEYERVAKEGILLCHMIEKEEFCKCGLNFSHLAGESILMRNGYNVKANVGLTDIQRQTILANVMDNCILTASQIISYLQMFIAQKKGLSSYKMAVDKWDADLQFVRLYKEDNKRRVFISSISKTAYRKV